MRFRYSIVRLRGCEPFLQASEDHVAEPLKGAIVLALQVDYSVAPSRDVRSQRIFVAESEAEGRSGDLLDV